LRAEPLGLAQRQSKYPSQRKTYCLCPKLTIVTNLLRVQRATTDVLTARCFDEIYCVLRGGLVHTTQQNTNPSQQKLHGITLIRRVQNCKVVVPWWTGAEPLTRGLGPSPTAPAEARGRASGPSAALKQILKPAKTYCLCPDLSEFNKRHATRRTAYKLTEICYNTNTAADYQRRKKHAPIITHQLERPPQPKRWQPNPARPTRKNAASRYRHPRNLSLPLPQHR
jgi:hypothetical protein